MYEDTRPEAVFNVAQVLLYECMQATKECKPQPVWLPFYQHKSHVCIQKTTLTVQI